MKSNVFNLLKSTAEFSVSLQRADGSFPSGHNGPYNDVESPVRNSAHFLKLYLNLYSVDKNEQYKLISENVINYLLGKETRPHNATYFCRKKKDKDKCNGLVGQAWVIESLVRAYEVLGREDCLEEALRLYQLHRQCDITGLWHRVEINGEELSFDPTFNHQLWFAAAAAILSKHVKQVRNDVELFISNVLNNLETYSDGTIFHASQMGRLGVYIRVGFATWLQQLKVKLRRLLQRKGLYSKSVGYHGFNLHAVALIAKCEEYKSLIDPKILKKISRPLFDINFEKKLENNIYGYFYNVTGFEFAFYSKVFNLGDEIYDKWLALQLKSTREAEHKLLTSGATDKNTAMARVYQLSELL